jgi:hypothetical protein
MLNVKHFLIYPNIPYDRVRRRKSVQKEEESKSSFLFDSRTLSNTTRQWGGRLRALG